jgi:hypothetical protein
MTLIACLGSYLPLRSRKISMRNIARLIAHCFMESPLQVHAAHCREPVVQVVVGDATVATSDMVVRFFC